MRSILQPSTKQFNFAISSGVVQHKIYLFAQALTTTTETHNQLAQSNYKKFSKADKSER